jgi:2-polyprenyl-6-methoxyphenol hydroxylase-like FAD-dependent oxidoreductase
MRILIVGAGIAGMTLAALLERRGVRATLIERAPNFEHAGYMLGLWPLGYRVLHGLSLYERFAAECVEGKRYEVRDNHGELVKQWSMEPIAERFGPNLSCTRPQLVRLLHGSLDDADLRFSTELEALAPSGEEVEATFSDGERATFDLVVGADGLHSRVRDLAFGEQLFFNTGWGGWVWWADLESVPAETFVEHWGAGRFVGASMAMESAAVLADELSRTDARFVERALSLYVKRRRDRVERIQDDSRHLARTMFIESAPVAKIRDLATKFYSIERLAGSLAKAFDEPI